ncbi:MBL fold metallo-hydrolase [Undibacterium cyanobacteriorum]|uniref:MBL fold metallo-hydrolase n=1 Tax=Undibacterium cyanobacteriorum TaxID=3073561 RepID=A0ABY9RGC0_9BURK|nr:MBL fold metallo-hydrolase [Undibacterium sp. 20NA77.5]WMW79680.1 MBL fold metallo-hydrolase [Undibacterium sp. 20NA77.5]
MLKKFVVPSILVSTLIGLGLSACAEAGVVMPKARVLSEQERACKSYDDWNEPTPARHVYGNTWYVGTCGISTILIASPQGHVVIDSGTNESFETLKRNLENLGIRLRDIRAILTTHEHHDHVGGVSRLQEVSGAVVYVREKAMKAMATGKIDRTDPQFEILKPMRPVKNLRVVKDGQTLKLAGTQFHNIPMPGHTPAGSGWRWKQCENSVCHEIVFSDSLGSISDDHYLYSAPDGLGISLRQSAERLAAQPCDILITGHTGGSNILPRLDGKDKLVDTGACKDLAKVGIENLDKRLAEEAEKKK